MMAVSGPRDQGQRQEIDIQDADHDALKQNCLHEEVNIEGSK